MRRKSHVPGDLRQVMTLRPAFLRIEMVRPACHRIEVCFGRQRYGVRRVHRIC